MDDDRRQCPECGWSPPLMHVPRRPWSRTLAWLLLTAACLGGLVWWAATNAERFSLATFTTHHGAAEGGWTISDIRRLAAGETLTKGNPPKGLVDSVVLIPSRLSPPGPEWIEVGFGFRRGERMDSYGWGWPGTWYSATRITRYADAAARQGQVPYPADPSASSSDVKPWKLQWGLRWSRFIPPGNDRLHGLDQSLHPRAFLLVPAAGAIFYWLAAGLQRVLPRVGAATRRAGPWPRRVGLFGAALAAASMAVPIDFGSLPHVPLFRTVEPGPKQLGRASISENAVRTGITRDQLESLRSQPGADAIFARAILDAIGGAEPHYDDVLVVGLESDAQAIEATQWHPPQDIGPRVDRLRFAIKSETGDTVPVARDRGVVFVRNLGTWHVGWASGMPNAVEWRARVDLGDVVEPIVLAWFLWLPVVWLPGWVGVRRRRRRLARGRCPACAYPLPAASPAERPR